MLRHPALKLLLGLILVAGVGYALWLGLSDPRIWEIEWHLQPLPIAAGFVLMLLSAAATAPLWLIIFHGLGGTVDTSNGARIFLAGYQGFFPAGVGGLYFSSNAGVNWNRIGFAGQDVNDVAIDPTDSNRVYAATAAG